MASKVIVAHNHPSGNLSPSIMDEKITSKIKDALSLIDVTLLDHMIITRTDYFSFAKEGLQ